MNSRFTAEEKHDAAVREVKYRKFVYERRVDKGEMTRTSADKQIALMQEIADDYAELMKKERLL